MPYLGVTPGTAAGADLDGKELILDADADTTITADTDDQIDIRIGGADDFQFTANTFTAQSGSTIAAQALTATTVNATGLVTAGAKVDLNGTELILDADADTSITADTDDTIDIRIAGADDFQFTANTFTAQSGSTIAAQALTATTGVFSSDVTGLTINATGDTAAADNAAIGYTAAEGLILTGQGSTNDVTIKNDADADVITIPTGGTIVDFASSITVANDLIMASASEVFIGDTAAANVTTGITINQGAADNNIIELKSSDVAHGYTDYSETDTFFYIQKRAGANGGVNMFFGQENAGTGEGVLNLQVIGPTTLTTTKTTVNLNSAVSLYYRAHNGSNAIADVNANGNVFGLNVSKASGAKWIFSIDEDGDIYQDGSTDNAFDAWDDAALLRSLQLQQTEDHKGRNTLALKDQVIKSRFDTNRYTKEHLEKARLIEVVSDEEWAGGDRSLLNETVRGYVQTGAIWQNHEMIDALMEAMEAAMKDAGVNDFQKDYVKPRFVERGLPTQILDWTGAIPDDVTVPDIAPTAFNL